LICGFWVEVNDIDMHTGRPFTLKPAFNFPGGAVYERARAAQAEPVQAGMARCAGVIKLMAPWRLVVVPVRQLDPTPLAASLSFQTARRAAGDGTSFLKADST
jgi:hypothetical protein